MCMFIIQTRFIHQLWPILIFKPTHSVTVHVSFTLKHKAGRIPRKYYLCLTPYWPILLTTRSTVEEYLMKLPKFTLLLVETFYLYFNINNRKNLLTNIVWKKVFWTILPISLVIFALLRLQDPRIHKTSTKKSFLPAQKQLARNLDPAWNEDSPLNPQGIQVTHSRKPLRVIGSIGVRIGGRH